MRILITNDDGIDGAGLHTLARAMTDLGEVVVIAPDREFSGASSAVGALFDFVPEVRRHRIDGVDEAWSLNGPPALCVMYARLGVFGRPFDLVVSGINPGANVGRSVYHSGTIGACLTARYGGISGVAVSQAVLGWGAEGQAAPEVVAHQKWDVAATVARAFVGGLVDEPPSIPVAVNLNVPNVALDEIAGWCVTEIGHHPPRSLASARLVPTDDPDRFGVALGWGDPIALPPDTDGGAIERGFVTVSYLTAIEHHARKDLKKPAAALDALLGG